MSDHEFQNNDEKDAARAEQQSQGNSIEDDMMSRLRALASLEERWNAEKSYDISLTPATYNEELTSQEVSDRLELDHVVKVAPRLDEQTGATRTNEITYKDEAGAVHTVTERQALAETREYLQTAIACESALWAEEDIEGVEAGVQSLSEKLTFIGEKEFTEATAGIAAYWKNLLNKDPQQKILALAGVTEELDGAKPTPKSDDYVLDAILAHFSDEEAEMYKGRLLTDPSKVPSDMDVRDLRTILVDDWTLSASQLDTAVTNFGEMYPQYASSVEVQLITAGKDQITHGLFNRMEEILSDGIQRLPVPVRAYYVAHEAPVAWGSLVHITGAHSSVDFEFQDVLEKVAARARTSEAITAEEGDVLETLPPLTHIVRPYRRAGAIFTQKERF